MTTTTSLGRLRRGWLVSLGAGALSLGVSSLGVTSATAAASLTTNTVIELDGNAVNGGATGEDWSDVYSAVVGSDDSLTAASDFAFVSDGSLTHSIYTGGGSKDPQPLANWRWKNGGGLPDKDNLMHAFAARYKDASKDLLAFGSDRYDNSGDAMQGFWFFQDEIAVDEEAPGMFSGEHQDGDILVISDFSVGGSTANVAVYQWDSTCTRAGGTCTDVNLRLLVNSSKGACGADDASICGIVNFGATTPWTVPWSSDFRDKRGNTSAFAAGEFFEGAIDLTAFPGLSEKCFASVISETRSSTSTTATLKDFVLLGKFGECTATVTSTPQEVTYDTSTDPATPQYADVSGDLTIGADGLFVADEATVEVGGASTFSGTMSFHLCGPSGGLETCDSSQAGYSDGGSDTVDQDDPTAMSDIVEITEPGDYCWIAEFASDSADIPDASDYSIGECFSVAAQPSLESAQKWVPNDKVTVTVPGGADADGTVDFELYTGSTCSGTLIYSEPGVTADATDGKFYTTNEDGIRTLFDDNGVTTYPTEVSWQVSFTANDGSGQLDIDPSCHEVTSILIYDDGSFGG